MIQAIRGMNDILPDKTPYWEFLERTARRVARGYGYREIRFPLVEATALFQRSIGEVTDIVEKEMYTFLDRNGDSLTLRPEGTAGCARAGIENGLLYNQIQRVWYLGPMFRHERPQKGRYRQFHQFAVEAYGLSGAEIDVEVILISARLLQTLGLKEKVTLELNTLGDTKSRAVYRAELVKYLEAHKEELDNESLRRIGTNPLRVLDSKNPAMQLLLSQAPKLLDYLDEGSAQQFKALCTLLDSLGVSYRVNPRLVRGLDYYSHTVFEWVTTELGAQGTVLAGGRYDTLVESLGGKSTPAVGFACGLERLILLLESVQHCDNNPFAYLIISKDTHSEGLVLAETLRSEISGLTLECDLSGSGLKSQFKRADKSGARLALIIGGDEVERGVITVKHLRGEQPQQRLSQSELINFLKKEDPTHGTCSR